MRRLGLAVLAIVALAALAGCGSAQRAVNSLDPGRYQGVDGAAVVDLQVFATTVTLDSRQTWLPDPTTTGTFLVRAQGGGYTEWHCAAAEQNRSLHCDVWRDPAGGPSPTAVPCISPGPGAPPWCSAADHRRVDLLKICTDPGCS